MLKVLGRSNSSNVQKVMIAVTELGIAHERSDIGGAFGGTTTPEYLAMNPNAKVPTLVEDDFVLWESNAIVRYLARKHGLGSLCPADAQACADADRWMDWQQTTTGPAIFPIFWGLVRTPEAERDTAAIEQARQAMIPLMQVLDARLAGRDWIMGDAFTMADIPLLIIAHRWLSLIADRPAMANLEGWYDRACARPSFKQNVVDIALT